MMGPHTYRLVRTPEGEPDRLWDYECPFSAYLEVEGVRYLIGQYPQAWQAAQYVRDVLLYFDGYAYVSDKAVYVGGYVEGVQSPQEVSQ